ncbi:hypothetical protein BH18ACT16_BH18ACT16_13500 [soil metagenome]
MTHHRLNRLTLFIATAAIVAATFHAPAAAAPPPASIKINDVSVDEGNSGVTLLTFTVVAKGKGAARATVDYANPGQHRTGWKRLPESFGHPVLLRYSPSRSVRTYQRRLGKRAR